MIPDYTLMSSLTLTHKQTGRDNTRRDRGLIHRMTHSDQHTYIHTRTHILKMQDEVKVKEVEMIKMFIVLHAQ